MKRNFLLKTAALLSSAAILGAASMLTAFAKGIKVSTVEAEPGTTSVEVPVYMTDVTSNGVELTFSSDSDVITSIECPTALVYDGVPKTGVVAIYVSGTVYKTDKPFDKIKVTLAPDAQPGEYPINVSIATLDDNGSPVKNPEGIAGAVVIKTGAAAQNSPDATANNSGAEASAETTLMTVTKASDKANTETNKETDTETGTNADTETKKTTAMKSTSDEESSYTGIIIAGIAAVMAIAGIAFFVIKKRKV